MKYFIFKQQGEYTWRLMDEQPKPIKGVDGRTGMVVGEKLVVANCDHSHHDLTGQRRKIVVTDLLLPGVVRYRLADSPHVLAGALAKTVSQIELGHGSNEYFVTSIEGQIFAITGPNAVVYWRFVASEEEQNFYEQR